MNEYDKTLFHSYLASLITGRHKLLLKQHTYLYYGSCLCVSSLSSFKHHRTVQIVVPCVYRCIYAHWGAFYAQQCAKYIVFNSELISIHKKST